MSNEKFYNRILELEQEGSLIFMPKSIPTGFYEIKIGKRKLALRAELVDFGLIIQQKIENFEFCTQKMIETYYDRTVSVINRLVEKGEYVQLKRSINKFYIKKDWE